MRRIFGLLTGCATAVVLLGCPSDDGEGQDSDSESGGDMPLFPADYQADYTEVRNCRGSGDHDLHNIRILAGPTALGPYQSRTDPFPEGAIVLKEEFDFGDQTCEGEILQWTVMQRLPTGSSPDTLDWRWQRVDAQGNVASVDEMRCISCHTGCGVAPDGFDGTCAMP
jgi:hypothetical protein